MRQRVGAKSRNVVDNLQIIHEDASKRWRQRYSNEIRER